MSRCRSVVWFVALACVALGIAVAGRPRPCCQTCSATRPGATSRPYRPAELAAECRRRAESLAGQLGAGFEVVVLPPFVVAGDIPAEQVRQCARRSVVAPAEVMWRDYFQTRPDKVVTVLLLAGSDSYRLWADKLFGDRNVPHFGYFKPVERTLVMNISTGTGTLVHELTHALIAFDFPEVPVWFNEGLASLHEQCNVTDDGIIGLVNWRLPGLIEAIRAERLGSLRNLTKVTDFYGRQRGDNYAQARYFVMYMQHRGLLKKFYKRFRDHHEGKDAGVEAVEGVFGKEIDLVEQDFIAWVVSLRYGRNYGPRGPAE